MLPQDHTHVTPAKEERYPTLDALRGIASLMVVLNHFHDMWAYRVPNGSSLTVRAAYLLSIAVRNGAAAVVLFFVLSGFVLSLPILRGKQQRYVVFVIRRVLRIYGPYLVALLLAIAGCSVFYRFPHPEGWGAYSWTSPPSWGLVFDHVLFVGAYNWRQYDFVIWSLIQEMRISLLFPLLVAAVQRLRWFTLLPMAMMILGYRWINGTETFDTKHWRQSIAQTIFYIAFFCAGVMLAVNLQAARDRWQSLPRLVRTVMGGLFLMLFAYGNVLPGLMGKRYHILAFDEMQRYTLGSLLELFGSLGCILLAIGAPSWRRVLSQRWCQILGRMSYSLYLTHPIVLFSITLGLSQWIGYLAQFPLYLITSLSAGWLFCVWIEERFIRLSRNTARLLRG